MIRTAAAPARPLFAPRASTIVEAQAGEPQAEVYANIGIETGHEKYGFMSLPRGVAIDTQQPKQVRGSDEDFVNFTYGQNELLAWVQDQAKSLKPGESVILTGLTIELRRRGGAVEKPASANNPFSLSALTTAKPATDVAEG